MRFPHRKAPSPPHLPARHGRDGRAAVPRRDGAGRHARWRKAPAEQHAPRLHRDGARRGRLQRARRQEEPVVAGGSRARRSTSAPTALQLARAVPRLPDDRQQHRRAQGRGVHAAGDRRRPLPLERGVPDAVAPEADAGLRRATPARRSTRSTRRRFGQDTPIPSMQLCIENVDQAGGCAYGYSCVYTDSISWASPTEPLPMIRDPRVAFDQLFGVGGTAAERAARRRTRRSILDWVAGEMSLAQDARSAPPTARASTATSRTSARSSAASSRSRRATPAASRASCPTRRPACPTRSPST